MQFIRLAAIAALGSCVAACGGGGGSGDDGGAGAGPNTPPAGTTTYAQGTPVVGTSDVFVTAEVDDSNNTIDGTYTQRVASVNADGSYTLTQVDPTGDAPVVNGIDYRFAPVTRTFDGKGEQLSADFTLADGTTRDCTFLTAQGHPTPWYVMQAWESVVEESCTPGSSEPMVIAGSVVNLESVTVPAGTFTALRLEETQTWTDANGQKISASVTHWVDPAHSLFTLKTITTYTRSGNVPAHYVVSQTVELQSRPGS